METQNKTFEELMRDSINLDKTIKKIEEDKRKVEKKLEIHLEKKKQLLENISNQIKTQIKKIK